MTANLSGRCVCGEISLTIAGDPVTVRQCWCRQCQQIAAGGATNNAIFNTTDVAIEGKLASSRWMAASGNTLTFYFCPSCGTQVYGQSSARPHLKTMRLGVIDVPHDLRPQMVIWTEDAPAWAAIDPSLPAFERQPPPPPETN